MHNKFSIGSLIAKTPISTDANLIPQLVNSNRDHSILGARFPVARADHSFSFAIGHTNLSHCINYFSDCLECFSDEAACILSSANSKSIGLEGECNSSHVLRTVIDACAIDSYPFAASHILRACDVPCITTAHTAPFVTSHSVSDRVATHAGVAILVDQVKDVVFGVC